MKEKHSNVLISLLRRGVDGGNNEASLNESWGSDSHLKGKIVVPEDPHKRILLPEEDGEELTSAGYLNYDKSNHRWTLTAKGIEFGLPHVEWQSHDVEEILRDCLSRAVFHPLPEDHPKYPGETPIPSIYQPGSSRLVLILGENAGGKSFFRRVMSVVTHRGRKGGFGDRAIPAGPFPVREMVHISMEGRTQGGIVGSMVYGTEEWRSTGENSSRTVTMGIKTAEERAHTCIMYWDEPDIGMSAGTAAGAGQSIAKFAEEANPLVQMVCVTSHSPALVQQLRHLDPHYIYLGNAGGPPTLDDWFAYQANPVPVMPEQVTEASHRRFKLIQTILKG